MDTGTPSSALKYHRQLTQAELSIWELTLSYGKFTPIQNGCKAGRDFKLHHYPDFLVFFGFGFATLTSDFGRGGVFSILRSRRSNFALSTRVSSGGAALLFGCESLGDFYQFHHSPRWNGLLKCISSCLIACKRSCLRSRVFLSAAV